MKIQKVIFFLLVLPLTLLLDLIIFAFVKTCPSCSSFWQWVSSEGAISFPLVVSLSEYFSQLLVDLKIKK